MPTSNSRRTRPAKPSVKGLYLSSDDKKLAGVCGGIAEYFEVDSSLIRLGWIIFTAVTAILPGVVAYIVAAIVVPSKTAA